MPLKICAGGWYPPLRPLRHYVPAPRVGAIMIGKYYNPPVSCGASPLYTKGPLQVQLRRFVTEPSEVFDGGKCGRLRSCFAVKKQPEFVTEPLEIHPRENWLPSCFHCVHNDDATKHDNANNACYQIAPG